ncbi:MAG: peptidoglycan editing factor PgeF [Candidatus Omnitrophica bacterium]|nr:peptidoglycan editing factor PgeF [Candidatus Omnitrophota bacterium]
MSSNLFDKFFPNNVVTWFSDSSRDFSISDSPPYLTSTQKDCLNEMVSFRDEMVVNIKQCHGSHCLPVTAIDMAGPEVIWKADSVATNVPNIFLSVRTSDCLPVFIYDMKKRCTALVHAGWKGTQKKVLQNTLKVLNHKWGCAAEDLMVGFGPSIRKCCYKVGEEFGRIFPDDTYVCEREFFFDLVGVNQRILSQAGVKNESIHDCGLCTCCREEYFSYRREGEKAGRHLSLMAFS